MPRTDPRWWLVIGGSLLAIMLVQLLVDDSAQLGLALPSIAPIMLGAYCYGIRGALYSAAVATVMFVIPAANLSSEQLMIATGMRALVFFGSGLLLAELLRRSAEQGALIAEQGRELEELRVLREALTPPEIPPTPGLELASAYVPAEHQVAGDFFLVVQAQEGRTVMAVGDAVGHGVAAARRASYVRAVLATLAVSSPDPGRLLELANAALLESDPMNVDFITAVCATFDGERLTWANAGHPAPWDLDSGRPLAELEPHEPLGIVAGVRYASATVELQPGRGVLLYSDGLIEARPVDGQGAQQFGEDAARHVLSAQAGAAPGQVVEAVCTAAAQFAGGRLADDLCLLAARRI